MKYQLPRLALAALAIAPLAQLAAAQEISVQKFDGQVRHISPTTNEPEVSGPCYSAAGFTEALNLIDLAIVSGDSLSSRLQDLEDLIATFPGSSELRLRLSQHVQDLDSRAAQAFVDASDAAMLRRQIVDERLDDALGQLRARAEGGGWSAEQIHSVVTAWIARSEVFVDAPDAAAYRARVQAAAEVAMNGAESAASYMLEMRLMLLQGRLEEARQVLLQRVAEGTMTRADYLRQYELITRRARLIASQGLDA